MRRRYRFFCDDNGFAADTDCTGVTVAALYEAGRMSREELLASGEELLLAAAPEGVPASQNLDEATGKSNGELRAGVIMVYWDDGQEPGAAPRGRKQDAAVAANALYALKLAAEATASRTPPTRGASSRPRWPTCAITCGAAPTWRGRATTPLPTPSSTTSPASAGASPSCRATLGGGSWRRALDESGASPPRAPGTAADPYAPLNLAQRVLAPATPAASTASAGTWRSSSAPSSPTAPGTPPPSTRWASAPSTSDPPP